jgi:hypothetical protein
MSGTSVLKSRAPAGTDSLAAGCGATIGLPVTEALSDFKMRLLLCLYPPQKLS